MATVGPKGIWGLEQLDKTGIATWKLGACVTSIRVSTHPIPATVIGGNLGIPDYNLTQSTYNIIHNT